MRLGESSEAVPTAPPSLVVCSGLAIATVAVLVSMRTVLPATTSPWLPRWDLAAHLLNGWTTYDHLRQGRLAGFLAEIWSQGYWPPGQSLFQVPFYVATSGGLAGGLLSSTAAFALTMAGAVTLLVQIAGARAWLPSAITIALMATSPFFLAYATVAMSEMVGALAQVLVLACYARYERTQDAAATRWLAGSLSVLFFTKYNYFILLAVPLVCHRLLGDASALSLTGRLRALLRVGVAWCTTIPGLVTIGYLCVVVTILAAGGISARVAGRDVAFRTVGYSLHPLLYGWLVYAWRSHRKGRWGPQSLEARDPRLLPFLVWFVAPVTVWLASPFPNHIKDLVYLVVNVPMGPASTQLGLSAYLTTIRSDYFAHPAVFVTALAGFLSAAARYGRQPTLVRLLIVTATLQFAMVSVHHTRDARFLLLAMPPFWMAAAHELGRWSSNRRLGAEATMAIAILGVSIGAAHSVMSTATFRRLAAEHYVTSVELRDALSQIRTMAHGAGTVAVVGRRDTVSPSLMKWELGPPRGLRQFPQEISRVADLARLEATGIIVVIEPSEVSTTAAEKRVMALVDAGTFVLARTLPVADVGVSLRVFLRTATGASPQRLLHDVSDATS